VPELSLDKAIRIGPDEIVYLFHDHENHRFLMWSRDYMSDLAYEAAGLLQQGYDVAKWFPVKNFKNDDYYRYSYGGDYYAIGLLNSTPNA